MNGEKCLRTMKVSLKSDTTYGLGLNLGLTGQKVPAIVGIDSGGPADKNGSIRVGDRVLEINNTPMKNLCVDELRKWISDAEKDGKYSVLTIEYDVSILSKIRSVGRIVIEFDHFKGKLGLTLTDASNSVIITKVGLGSFAERCGAFQVGDTILSARSSERKLKGRFSARDFAEFIENDSGPFKIELLIQCVGQEAKWTLETGEECDLKRIDQRPRLHRMSVPAVRVETQMVTLDLSSFNEYGIVYKRAHAVRGVVVCHIAPNSPAAKSGVLQIGDRIVMVNGFGLTNDLLRLEDVGPEIHLLVHFDVQVWPDERKPLETVLLQRNSEPDYGFSIACYKNEVVVSNISHGSIAHRCGQMQVGDRLLSINGVEASEKEATQVLIKSSRHSIRLQIKPNLFHSKDRGIGSFFNRCQPEIIYSSRAANQEVLDWGMESNSSFSDSSRSSQDFSESSDACSVDAQSNFLFSLDLTNKEKHSISPAAQKAHNRINKAYLKINFQNPSPKYSRSGIVSLKRIPVPLNSSFCMSCWLELKDELPEREVEVVLKRKSVLQSFGFSVIEENGQLFVKNILSGSPSWELLRPQDQIVRINRKSLCSVDGIGFMKQISNVGRYLILTVVRKETLQTVKRFSRWVDEIATEAQPRQPSKQH